MGMLKRKMELRCWETGMKSEVTKGGISLEETFKIQYLKPDLRFLSSSRHTRINFETIR
jgi:hypothetical protein